MAKSSKLLFFKLVFGILIIFTIWWLVRCQCLNLKSLTPASIRDYLGSFGSFAAVIYVIAYVLNTISMFPPIAPLSLTAGLAFGAAKGAILLMIAAMVGTSATFAISRFFGRRFIESILKGKFKNLDEKLEKNSVKTVLFFRLIPIVPYEVLNYICGLSKMKFRHYFLATLLGLVPGVVIAAFFGGSLGKIGNLQDLFT